MEQSTNQMQTETTQPSGNQSKKGMMFGMIACAVLGIAGIAFGVYGMIESNNKASEVSTLKTSIEDKTTTITELETKLSNLSTKSEATITPESEAAISSTESTETAGTASIVLGEILDENETRTVFNIGSCTADGPSVKCSITTPNGEALISYVTTDYILRLTLPNN